MADLLLGLRKRMTDCGFKAVGTKNNRNISRNTAKNAIKDTARDTERKLTEEEPQTTSDNNSEESTQKAASREEFLLNQIVEFRERAQQLQELLDTKETEAREYQILADERKNKADELGEILKDHQEKTDGLAVEVEKQIDLLIAKVSAKMDEIEHSVRTELQEGRQFDDEKSRELKDTLAQLTEQLTEQLASVTTELTTTKTELSDKVHVENVKCYRNISELFKNIEEKINRLPIVENKLATMKNYMMATIILSILNFIVILITLIVNFGFGTI
jgi:hypothetical protein